MHTAFGKRAIEDDLIDDSGLELGMPSITDMLRHQCDLDVTRRETERGTAYMGYAYGDYEKK